MSGATASSLSLAWSLEHGIALDHGEAIDLTVRPWAPFLLSSQGGSVGQLSRDSTSRWAMKGEELIDEYLESGIFEPSSGLLVEYMNGSNIRLQL